MSSTESQNITGRAAELYDDGRWRDACVLLEQAIERERDAAAVAELQLALVRAYSLENWAGSAGHSEAKHALIDALEQTATAYGDDHLLAAVLLERGTALHLDFILSAAGDPARELESFTRAAELYQSQGDVEGAALSTAFLGIFHHVVRLDRATAEPILRRAYDMSSAAHGSEAHAEAARHLGQIRQELGEPEASLELLEESLQSWQDAGGGRHLAPALHALGHARLEAGDLDGAARDLAQARELAERYSQRLWLAFIARTEADLEFARLCPGVAGRTHP
jgi:tetratricopeptide (TPR) repeat protein